MYAFPLVSQSETCFSQNSAPNLGLIPLYTAHDCRIIFNVAVDRHSVKALIEAINAAFTYYQYPLVTIDIDSPGGEIRALHFLMSQFERWRKESRRIATSASVSVSSAAAAILALGDHGTRNVDKTTSLLFHFARIFQPNSTLTADKASRLAKVMSREDERIIDRLLGHVVGPVNDPQAQGWRNQTRTRLTWARSYLAQKDVSDHFYFPEARNRLQALEKLISSKRKKALRDRVQEYLKSIFLKDEPIDLLEAWCLNLIDEIRDVTPRHVQPQVQQQTVSPPTSRERRGMSPACS